MIIEDRRDSKPAVDFYLLDDGDVFMLDKSCCIKLNNNVGMTNSFRFDDSKFIYVVSDTKVIPVEVKMVILENRR